MKQTFAVPLFVFAAAVLIAQTSANAGDPAGTRPTAGEPTSIGAWAESPDNPMQGLNLRARLLVSETTDISGSRTALAYVDFQNANHSINTVYVHSYFGLDCELRDSNGKTVPKTMFSYDGVAPELSWLALPCDSILRCHANPPAILKASGGELLVVAGWGSWRIPRGDTNDYFLSGTLNLTVPKGETPPIPRHWINGGIVSDNGNRPYVCQGTLKLPPVKISAGKP